MNEKLKRVLFFLGGFMFAFTSALSTMPGGLDLTLAQVGQVPLIAWGLSIGGGITAALNGKVKEGQK